MKFEQLRNVMAIATVTTCLGFPVASWGSFSEGEEAYLKQDHFGAFLKFVELAKKGEAPAQAMIGRIYLEGLGAPLDYRTAAISYEKAANQGNATAQFQLAKMYALGAGVKQDPVRAAQLMEKSAEQGVLWSMYSIGQMYKEGNGVTQDTVQALKWMNLAAAFPESPSTAEYVKLARAAKTELESSIGVDRVRESQKLTAQWNAARRTRDDQWQKEINRPVELRPPDPKAAAPGQEKSKDSTPLTRDFFPQSK